MSSSGLLIEPDEQMLKGQLIELGIRLPAPKVGTSGSQLAILGRVVRSDSSGVAISVTRHGFIRPDQPDRHVTPIRDPIE